MKTNILAGIGLAALITGGAVVRADVPAGSTSWVHVRVDQGVEKKVNVNLPLTVVQAVLSAAPEKVSSQGRIHISRDGHDLSVAELRNAWRQLSAAGDTEIVTVEEKDGTVHIGRKGDKVEINVDKANGREKVRVQVPVDVVDALLSGEGDELDIKAAISRLQARGGDLVTVHGQDGTVRVWIDDRAN